MRKIQKEVVDWHQETFPVATLKAITDKMEEELVETLDEVRNGTDKNALAAELSDVVIVACSLLERLGIDFESAIRNKLETNKKRTWGPENSEGDRPRVK